MAIYMTPLQREDKDWTNKYLRSDHHSDRFIRTILGYEYYTGQRFEDPEPYVPSRMARGSGRRGSGPDVVLVTTRKFRTFDDGDLDVFNVGHQASRIRSYAIDDHETMSNRSRRQDQALMRDITSRLSQLNQQPVRSSHSRPVFTTTVQSGSRRSSVVYPSHSTPPRHFRASSVPPLHHASTTTVHASPSFTLLTPTARRGYHYAIDDWFYPQHHIPRRPFVRAGSEPPRGGYTDVSTNMAVQNARRSLFKLEREIGSYSDWDIDDEPAIRTTSVRSRRVRASSVEPPEVMQKVATYGARSAPFRGRSSSYVTPVRSSRVRQLEEEWASEPELPRVVPQSLSSLRVRTAEARSKMDRSKVLLDRYLPLPGGAPPEVEYEIANKYGELAASARQLALLSRLPGETLERYYARQRRTPITTTNKGALIYDHKIGGYKYRPRADYTTVSKVVTSRLPWNLTRYKYFGLDDSAFSWAFADSPLRPESYYKSLSDSYFWNYYYKYPLSKYSPLRYNRYYEPLYKHYEPNFYSSLAKYYDPLAREYDPTYKYHLDPYYKKYYLGEPLYSYRHDPLYRYYMDPQYQFYRDPSWRKYGSDPMLEFPLRHYKVVVPARYKGTTPILALPSPPLKESATVEFPLQRYTPGDYCAFTRRRNLNATRNIYLRSAGILF